MGGPIDSVLVANRGEIACRIIRTCRLMGLGTTAVYASPDASAAHVLAADVAVPLDGDTTSSSYLDIDALVGAARRTGACAVHPGYGFLAENADFAEACLAAGLTWIGPAPASIRAMALKVPAKDLVKAHGVPVLPSAPVVGDDESAWTRVGDGVGYPLLVKASAGGGGKGMRRVLDRTALAEAIRAGRRESASSFGDPTVFVERLLERPRHVEVQVVGDEHGNVIQLGDRDCSIQRRNQKVIEEAPAPNIDERVRRALHQSALRVAEAIDYVGVGTVEFLLADDEFFFLEMNTRLQVEHPVTEAVFGLDLVRLQLEVAAGRPLSLTQQQVEAHGHAIEARINAEDPRRDYLPSIGRLHTFDVDTSPLRVDSWVDGGAEISPHYDSLLAKVISHAPNRGEAIDVLANGLRRARLHGLPTTRDTIVATLTSAEFRAADVDTDFLERHPEVTNAAPSASVRRRHAIAAAMAIRLRGAEESTLPRAAPPGWRNVRTTATPYELADSEGDALTVGLGASVVEVDGEPVDCAVVDVSSDRVEAIIDNVRRRYDVKIVGKRVWVNDTEWQTELEQRTPLSATGAAVTGGGLISPLPGSVVAVPVREGDVVDVGDVLVVIEAMKVEHRIVADASGVVTALHVAVGDRVDAHQVVAEVTPGGNDL